MSSDEARNPYTSFKTFSPLWTIRFESLPLWYPEFLWYLPLACNVVLFLPYLLFRWGLVKLVYCFQRTKSSFHWFFVCFNFMSFWPCFNYFFSCFWVSYISVYFSVLQRCSIKLFMCFPGFLIYAVISLNSLRTTFIFFPEILLWCFHFHLVLWTFKI